MAVENKYVNSNVASDTKDEGLFAGFVPVKRAVVTFEVAAGDDDGSIYRLLRGVSSDIRLTKVEIVNDAITDGTDYDLGVYSVLEDGGAVIDKDCLMDGVSMASARAVGSPASGLSIVNQANLGKKLWELAGQSASTRTRVMDIALTANTVGTAAGTITVMLEVST